MALRSTGFNKGNHYNKQKSGPGKCENEKDAKTRKETRICYYCQKQRHLKPDCRLKKAAKKERAAKEEKTKSAVQTTVMFFRATVCTETQNDAENLEGWCVDSGASSHMTKDAQFFTGMRVTSTIVNITDGSQVAAEEVREGYLWCETQSGSR